MAVRPEIDLAAVEQRHDGNHVRNAATARGGDPADAFKSQELLDVLLDPHIHLLLLGRARPAWQTVDIRSRTSSSVVCEKSSYQSPTARKGCGVTAQMMSSTAGRSAAQVSGAATGTATTMRSASCWRSAWMAASIVAPVAKPSSTRMTVWPRTSGGGRSPR